MLAYVRRIANVIEAGQGDGTFVNVPAMAQALLILGIRNGTTEWYGGTRAHYRIDEVADFTARLALSGVMGHDQRPQ
jgi:hypothetical protein